MTQEFRRLNSNTISKAEEMWDVQERDGRFEMGTGKGPSHWEEDNDSENMCW